MHLLVYPGRHTGRDVQATGYHLRDIAGTPLRDTSRGPSPGPFSGPVLDSLSFTTVKDDLGASRSLNPLKTG